MPLEKNKKTIKIIDTDDMLFDEKEFKIDMYFMLGEWENEIEFIVDILKNPRPIVLQTREFLIRLVSVLDEDDVKKCADRLNIPATKFAIISQAFYLEIVEKNTFAKKNLEMDWIQCKNCNEICNVLALYNGNYYHSKKLGSLNLFRKISVFDYFVIHIINGDNNNAPVVFKRYEKKTPNHALYAESGVSKRLKKRLNKLLELKNEYNDNQLLDLILAHDDELIKMIN